MKQFQRLKWKTTQHADDEYEDDFDELDYTAFDAYTAS